MLLLDLPLRDEPDLPLDLRGDPPEPEDVLVCRLLPCAELHCGVSLQSLAEVTALATRQNVQFRFLILKSPHYTIDG